MKDGPPTGEHYDVKIEGNTSGQIATGKNIQQHQTVHAASSPVTTADMDELRAALAALRTQVEAAAPPDEREGALMRVDELTKATLTEKPKLSTMEYVRDWFVDHIPQLAGAVTGVVVHPIVGKLVEAAGDSLAGEWRRRFGGK